MRRKKDGQDTVAVLYTCFELKSYYTGRQVRDTGDNVKRKIVNNLIPKWLENVDSEGNPFSGKTFEDVLEAIRLECYVEDIIAKRRAAASKSAKIHVDAMSFASKVEKEEEYKRNLEANMAAAGDPPTEDDCPSTYEPFAWIAFKLFGFYGNKTMGLPMLDMLLAANDANDAADDEETSKGSRGRRGKSRKQVAKGHEEDKLSALEKEESASAMALAIDRETEQRRIDFDEVSLVRQMLYDNISLGDVSGTTGSALEWRRKYEVFTEHMLKKVTARMMSEESAAGRSTTRVGAVRAREDEPGEYKQRRVRIHVDDNGEEADPSSSSATGSSSSGPSSGACRGTRGTVRRLGLVRGHLPRQELPTSGLAAPVVQDEDEDGEEDGDA
jgi:hypothetical protein